MPKKQPTAAKKARAIQRAAGAKYTDALTGQVCGDPIHPLDDLGTCARPPHSTWEPHSEDRGFDPAEFYRAEGERLAEERRRWEGMSPQVGAGREGSDVPSGAWARRSVRAGPRPRPAVRPRVSRG